MNSNISHLVLFLLVLYFQFSFIPYYDPSSSIIQALHKEGSSTNRISDIELTMMLILACWILVASYDDGGGDDQDEDHKQIGELYTLHFDGSDKPQCHNGGAGCIIRDQQGELVLAASCNLDHLYPDCNVAVAEAVGLCHGLWLAKKHSIKLELIKGDNQQVVNHVKGQNQKKRKPRVPLSHIIEEILLHLNEQSIDHKCEVKLVRREANRVADKLADVGCSLNRGERVVFKRGDQHLPSQVASLIEEDKIDSWHIDCLPVIGKFFTVMMGILIVCLCVFVYVEVR